MKIPTILIENATSKDKTGYMMQSVYLDTIGKRLIATEGHILSSIAAEVGADDVSGCIPAEALRTARKLLKEKRNKYMSSPVEIAVNGKVKVSDGVATLEFEKLDGTFPNYQLILDQSLTGDKMSRPATITFNVNQLLQLAQALGEPNRDKEHIVSLRIENAMKPIVVTHSENSEAIGLLMPTR